MKVFISSTYEDLPLHRLAVATALDRLGLQVSRMETFGTNPEPPTIVCYEEIETSELFVGIYAHRYGFIPDGGQASITELEFNHAVDLRRPTFCYFVDEAYAWPDEHRQPEVQLKLKSFKDHVAERVVRDFFSTPSDLALNVAASVGRFLIADPRRHGARRTAEFLRVSIADTSAALLVDAMRLTGVAARGERAAPLFWEFADQHSRDLFMYVSRLQADSDFDVIQKADAVARSLGSALMRLRASPPLDLPWRDFVEELCSGAERVHALLRSAAADYYEERSAGVAPVISRLTLNAQDAASARTFVSARMRAQDAVLELLKLQRGVRYDIERRLAIPYFLIDLTLLRSATH